MDKKELEYKKEYLRGYEKAVRQMRRIEVLLQEMRRKRMNVAAPNIDDLPHAHNITDLSSYAADLDAEEKNYRRAISDCMDECKKIFDAIGKLDNEDEKDVLVYRYINLAEWGDICKKIGLSERQVHRIHIRGLNNIKVEPDSRQQS